MLTARSCRQARAWLPLACILLVALAFRLALVLVLDLHVAGDAELYDRIAWNLAQGHGFSSSVAPPYLPTARVVPGYPVFLAVLYALLGHQPMAAIFAQVLLELGTVYLVYLCGRRLFDTRAALLAAALAALCPPLAAYASRLLTETLFTFLLVLFCWLVLRATDSETYGSLAWASLVAAAATMVRAPILAFLPLWALGLLALMRSLRRLLPRLALMVVCTTVIIAPWMARNYLETGRAVLAAGEGIQLYVRALRTTHTSQEARDHFHQQEDTLLAAGYSVAQADQIMQEQGLKMIASDPLPYVASLGAQCIVLWRGSFSTAFRMQDFSVYVNERDWAAIAVKILLSVASNLLPPLVVVAMIARRKSFRRWWPLALLLLYWTVFFAAASSLVSRYMVPVLPVAYIFSAQGLLFVWGGAKPLLTRAQGAHNRG